MDIKKITEEMASGKRKPPEPEWVRREDAADPQAGLTTKLYATFQDVRAYSGLCALMWMALESGRSFRVWQDAAEEALIFEMEHTGRPLNQFHSGSLHGLYEQVQNAMQVMAEEDMDDSDPDDHPF